MDGNHNHIGTIKDVKGIELTLELVLHFARKLLVLNFLSVLELFREQPTRAHYRISEWTAYLQYGLDYYSKLLLP